MKDIAVSAHEDPWLCVSDPAISASAELLERGSLLYNLRAWAAPVAPMAVVAAVAPAPVRPSGTFGDLTDLEKKIVSLVADHAPDSKLALLRRRRCESYSAFMCLPAVQVVDP